MRRRWFPYCNGVVSVRVVILHDAVGNESRPDELDALEQARFVADALHGLGHDTTTLSADLDLELLMARLRSDQTELVFNLVESLAGYGRLFHVVPALLEANGIAFTGNGSSACLLTTNKVLAKIWLHQWGIPTPPWRSDDAPAPCGIVPPCGCIIKPTWEDASVGIEDDAVIHVQSEGDLQEAVKNASRNLGDVFAEQFVEGREINVSLLADGEGIEVLPVAEIEFLNFPAAKPRIVGYRAKWDEAAFEYAATPRKFEFSESDAPLLDQIRDIAVRCWRIFGLRGYARVDFRVDEGGHPWVLEVNANPCLSADAGFMAAAQRCGLSARDIVNRIIATAIVPRKKGDIAPHA